MKNLGRTLLLVGVLVLALLIGILVGRGQRVQPTAEGAATAVQITTAAPPPVTAAPEPLPAPVQAPPVVAPPRIAIDEQVQEDAAAVGMTTRDDAPPAEAAPEPAAPRSADMSGQSEPVG